jgi:hypothetical protein
MLESAHPLLCRIFLQICCYRPQLQSSRRIPTRKVLTNKYGTGTCQSLFGQQVWTDVLLWCTVLYVFISTTRVQFTIFYSFVDARRPIKVQLQHRACALPARGRGQTHRCDYVGVPVMMQGNVCYYKEDSVQFTAGVCNDHPI